MQNALAVGSPGWLAGLKLILLALVCVWMYKRVTNQDSFLVMAAAFGLNGILALIFLSGKNVLGGAFGVIINAIAFIGILLVLNGITCSKLIHLIPKLNIIERELLVDPEKGVQLHFTAVTALMVILLTHLVAPGAYALIETKKGLGLGGMAYMIYLLLSVGIGYFTHYVIPWKEERDAFVTGDIKLEPLDIFEVKQEVTLLEKVGVPLGFFIFFCLIPFLLKEEAFKSDLDKVGLGVIFIVISSITYIEFFHKKKKNNAISIK